ncbi:unnamed protein product, partial [marine sediment metagenome]
NSVGSGPMFSVNRGLAVEASGDILVTDLSFNFLVRVDPLTGNRTVVSGCAGNPCSSIVGGGLTFRDPEGIEVEADGQILVADLSRETLFRVDPISGDRAIASSASVGTGPGFAGPAGVALDAGDDLLVVDRGITGKFLARVDPQTGDRTIVSGCPSVPKCGSITGGGPIFEEPRNVARIGRRAIEVAIDIKPGSDPNPINPMSKGVIPVAILGSDTF